ncbi:unnamed protein product [Bemisia tabaci]|uniref:Uncharacterized protein n=1 Tax=Bemisia tabaci TaxID=7038 RepID=A0A9P0F4A6_BEMTA|nr:PREDICTED: uncharacterized protein LOC109037943 [Bemisia tabaci]CAH0389111.1 unnamed protein product [Bemisia tabaci]
MAFEEMRAQARKIDEGINALEKKLQNPSLIGYLDDDVQERAVQILDELLQEMDIIDSEVSKYSADMTEDLHDIKSNCESLESYIETMEENIDTMTEFGKQYGYVPPAHLVETIESEDSDLSQLSQNYESSVKIEDETPILIDSGMSNSLRSDNLSVATNETWEQGRRPASQIMNETFTTPCSMYKVRHLNLPDVSEVKNLSFSKLSPAMASSSPKFLKPKFNLDETASTLSDAAFTINSSESSSFSVNPRRLSRYPVATNHLQTPPEPELSSLSRRLLHKSAVKKKF